MPSVLIVGASRGIGLGLVETHLEAGWRVHATTRDGLAPLEDPAVITHPLEVRDPDQLADLVAGLDDKLDRIIHNAGINRAPRAEMMAVNAEAPICIVEGLLEAGCLVAGGTVAIMTSQAGARRGSAGSLGDYGDSKAALNDEFRRRAAGWGEMGAVAVVIHPGWVRTDMGGSGAPISVEESAGGVLRLLDGLGVADHGKFLTWDGRIHPW